MLCLDVRAIIKVSYCISCPVQVFHHCCGLLKIVPDLHQPTHNLVTIWLLEKEMINIQIQRVPEKSKLKGHLKPMHSILILEGQSYVPLISPKNIT